jgi:glycerol-3-phosphate acyltransferase PlsY
VTYAALFVLGYLLGSCPWGYWLVRIFRGSDVRAQGSGNIGITNVWRNYGPRLGVPLIFLDVGKGFVPAFVGVVYVSRLGGIVGGAAAMLGHYRPLFLGFQKGGKMIATGGGAFFAIAPLVAATGLTVWLIVFLLFGYSSGASLATAAVVPVASWAWGYAVTVIVFALVAAVLAAWLHRSNVQRLWSGTERRSRVALIPRLRVQRS